MIHLGLIAVFFRCFPNIWALWWKDANEYLQYSQRMRLTKALNALKCASKERVEGVRESCLHIDFIAVSCH